jgi:hypothetical protein
MGRLRIVDEILKISDAAQRQGTRDVFALTLRLESFESASGNDAVRAFNTAVTSTCTAPEGFRVGRLLIVCLLSGSHHEVKSRWRIEA